MDIYTLLVVTHLIGAILGVGAATFAEIFLLKAVRDGEVDPIESSFLQVTYRVIRAGLAFGILSGFGFLLYYRLNGSSELLFDPVLLAKLTILIIILINAILLQARRIPLWLGSALSFASWWSAALLVPLGPDNLTYVGILAFYVLGVGAVAGILHLVRSALGIKFH